MPCAMPSKILRSGLKTVPDSRGLGPAFSGLPLVARAATIDPDTRDHNEIEMIMQRLHRWHRRLPRGMVMPSYGEVIQ